MQKLNFGRHVTSGDRWCLRSSKLHPITFPSSSIFCRVFRYREWQDSYFSADCCLSKQCLPSLCWTETWHCLSLSLSCGSVIHFLFTVLGFISPSVMKKPFSHKQHCLTIKKEKKNLSRWGEGRGSYPSLGQELGVHNFGLGRRRKKQDFMSG